MFIDRPPTPASPHHGALLCVVATPTRDVAPDALADYLEPLAGWFAGAGLAFKKVDSLLRGNTFAEIAWLMRHAGFTRALFAPAFPAQGRITVDDRQWVVKPGAGRVAAASPLCATFASLGLRSSTTYAREADVWIPAIECDADLDRVVVETEAACAEGSLLWCGSAGLAHALARRRGLAPTAGQAAPAARGDGVTLLISASFQPVLYAQWDALKAQMPTAAIAERARVDEIAHAARLVREGAMHARFDLSPRREMTQDESLALLHENIQRIVDGLPAPAKLLIVGGDTLLGVCRATGARALLAGASIRTGWGCASLVGGRWDGTRCYSRSGAFGDPDDLVKMMRLLTGGANIQKGN